MVFWVDTQFDLDEERLCKRIRIDGDSFSDISARNMIPELKEIAKQHADIRTVYLVGNKEFKTEIEEIDSCEKQIICLCYASDKIINIISDMMEKGDYLESYILNDLTNDVLFNASNQMNEIIFDNMKKEGLFLTEKYSPGERGISLEKQTTFLNLFLNETDLDVQVNESHMLIPEKAMMYGFGADKCNPERSVKHDCKNCENINCFFRVEK